VAKGCAADGAGPVRPAHLVSRIHLQLRIRSHRPELSLFQRKVEFQPETPSTNSFAGSGLNLKCADLSALCVSLTSHPRTKARTSRRTPNRHYPFTNSRAQLSGAFS